ncbi:MAG: hypothetical protein R2793_08580 [Flavobacteriaceae bacterium]
MKRLFFLWLPFFMLTKGASQNTFEYTLELNPITIQNLPGLHSYAFGQSDGKWLIIGGRRDGLHARQPFNAFPASQNNDELFVIDLANQTFWSTPLTPLPTGIREQLQSTNMNFHQDGDTLYIIGGYAFSATQNNHITFPNLTSINVPATINAIINNQDITPFFKQISDAIFAVSGGQLAKLGATFYLVGGHKFNGRYNPMGNPTYTQEYTNAIRKFTIDNSGSQLSYDNYTTIEDPVHLHRRDYNLLPQVFPNGTEGLTISSGVFQQNVDLPYLYPVDIDAAGITPMTSFNQFLSNYHSASAYLRDASSNTMFSLFFGGMSQYYYQNGNLIQDDLVPFVKTISLLVRDNTNTLEEFQLPIEMPIYTGSSAEFILNENLPHYGSGIVKLSEITEESFVLGYIYGGINSSSLNPFSSNQTNLTSASAAIYEVTLTKEPLGIQKIDGSNPYQISLSPNPATQEVQVTFNKAPLANSYYFLTTVEGKIARQGAMSFQGLTSRIVLPKELSAQTYFLTVSIDDRYFVTKKLFVDSQ